MLTMAAQCASMLCTMPLEEKTMRTQREPTATQLVNQCNHALRAMYFKARAKQDAILTGLVVHTTSPEAHSSLGFPVGVNLFAYVMPRSDILRLLRQVWPDKAEIDRITSKSAVGIFEVYVITKDALSVFRKPVAEFVAFVA